MRNQGFRVIKEGLAMNIKLRRINKDYIDVHVEAAFNDMDLGFHGKQECLELAQHLESIVDELLSGWNDEEKEGKQHLEDKRV